MRWEILVETYRITLHLPSSSHWPKASVNIVHCGKMYLPWRSTHQNLLWLRLDCVLASRSQVYNASAVHICNTPRLRQGPSQHTSEPITERQRRLTWSRDVPRATVKGQLCSCAGYCDGPRQPDQCEPLKVKPRHLSSHRNVCWMRLMKCHELRLTRG